MMNQESIALSYGLTSAVSWGAGDFSGGLAARRCKVLTVILFSQMIGGVFLLAVAILFKEPIPPIGPMLREIREHSPSIKIFLDTVAPIKSLEDLQEVHSQVVPVSPAS